MSKLNDPLQYVEDLELGLPSESFRSGQELGLESVSATDLVAESGEQAFIADKSLVSFVSEINGQARQDVLNSLLLAQLAANKKADIGKDLNGWYNAFLDVLKQVGWVIEKDQRDKFHAKHGLFEVEEVILEILASAFGAPYLVLIKNTLGALKKMAEKENGRIKVFEQNTVQNEKGCMQVGTAVAENDAVSLQMGTFMITSTSKIKRILFFKFNKDHTGMEYASCKATLNVALYNGVRNKIEEKISSFMSDFVAEIDL